MMDDSAQIHERRKLVKTYKNMLPQKRTRVAEVYGEIYTKNGIKDGVEKTYKMYMYKINPTI